MKIDNIDFTKPFKRISKSDWLECIGDNIYFVSHKKLHSFTFEDLQATDWENLIEEIIITDEGMKKTIINIFKDQMADFLYYDRKECEYLSIGDIENYFKKYPEDIRELENILRELINYCGKDSGSFRH